MNRTQVLLAAVAALLCLNLGYMIGSREASPMPLAGKAQAGSIYVSSKGEIFTSSADGTTLYLWYDDRHNAPNTVYKTLKFSH